MGKGTVIEVRIFPPTTAVLSEMRDFVLQTGAMLGVTEEILRNIALAVDEAATNVIRHVASHHPCNIGCACETNSAGNEVSYEISWEDDKPFNPSLPEKQTITERIENLTPGGLGIYLMHHLVDDIAFDYQNGKCVVTLKKKV